MKRRIVSIICIMFLLFTATTPLSGGVFSYADEPQQEQLSQDEVIKAAIALYLNERKAWITSTTSAPIDAVQNQMQIWIDSYDFWTNHTTIGSAAAFYAQCIVRYNPFRISLKGPAVRALNDLYNWLIDSGKLPNLEADNSGGETSDEIYDGKMIGGQLVYFTNQSRLSGYQYYDKSKLTWGSDVYLDGQRIFNVFKSSHSDVKTQNNTGDQPFSIYSTYIPNDSYYNIQFAPGITKATRFSFSQTKDSNTYLNHFSPRLLIYNYSSGNNSSDAGVQTNCVYCENGIYSVRGHFCNMMFAGENSTVYYGLLSYNYTNNKYTFWNFGDVSVASSGATNAEVNFDTDNFNKTDPTPPEGDDEVTYTPEDKTTGDTYNTYNEYISNYVTKNTVVNNNNSGGGGGSDPDDPEDPETPGGTTPPWDNSSGAGTLTPDGNGGYNFNLPDLTLPDLNIDWNIRGLSEKFPFSIPWDLMAFFTVLNAEPETPAIEAQIDLGIVDWDIDWDLHNFDTLAALLRNLEFIGFCLALILITRSIIKG